MSNPEIIKSGSDSSGEIWTETMADIEKENAGPRATYEARGEKAYQAATEQEINKEELISSIKRGYFEKSPEDMHTETARTICRAGAP